MIQFLTSIFSSGIIGSVEKIALEAIDTDKETAEAQSLFIKTLDPNGNMRRELSRFACIAYGYYLIIASILLLLHSFGVGDTKGSLQAVEAMKELFLPITTAWGTIVTASFGVNGINSYKGKT